MVWDTAEHSPILIASRGEEARHGLLAWSGGSPALLAKVDQLSALAWHPTLPVVYGTAGVGRPGEILAWRLAEDFSEAELLSHAEVGSNEREPCHVAVSPDGRAVVVTAYTSGTLAVWPLEPDGALGAGRTVLPLFGAGPDPDRQDAAHPHQAVFVADPDGTQGTLLVVDLGADRVRRFSVEVGDTGVQLRQVSQVHTPPGTGPRHLVLLRDGRIAVSGELSETLIIGPTPEVSGPEHPSWEVLPSTERSGAAKTRSRRNYPGDLALSSDGTTVIFCNRGHDTLSVFDVSQRPATMVQELDAGVAWPQHLLVTGDRVLCAGWDSSAIVSCALAGGRLSSPELLLQVSGPGWILPVAT